MICTTRCPWCGKFFEIRANEQGRHWAECVNERCPVQPMGFAFASGTEAIESIKIKQIHHEHTSYARAMGRPR